MCSSFSVWGHVLNSIQCEFTKWLGTIFCGQVHWTLIYVTVGKIAIMGMLHLDSVQLSRSVVSDSLTLHGLQHNRPPCPSPTPGVYSNSCPSSQCCHPTISSSCCSLLLLPSIFPSISVFSNESVLRIRWPKYWEFQLQHQSMNISVNIQDWFSLGWSGWISFQFKGFSRVSSNTTVQKHQRSAFFIV